MSLQTPQGYLSPNILGLAFDPHNASSYNGFASDVWAAGACLHAIVRQGRTPFSFEADAAAHGPQVALRLSFREVSSSTAGGWHGGSAATRNAFSAPLASLLDRMLEPGEAARIDMAGVAAHEWTMGELSPAAEAALAAQSAAQASMPPLVADYDRETAIERIAFTASVAPKGRLKRGEPAIEMRLSLANKAPAGRDGAAAVQPPQLLGAPADREASHPT